MNGTTALGRYRIVRRLAIGGTSEVFLAEYPAPDGSVTPVVIKRILPQYAENPEVRTLFRDESALLARLRHRNIVALLGSGEIDGCPYLALEFIDGATLATLRNRAHDQENAPKPSLHLALYISREISAALHYVHRVRDESGNDMQIVHRDISPQNILISKEGRVKLSDFGIAKSLIRATHTMGIGVRGKACYMSPEQATLGASVDHRSDLFSLGLVLYEMLTGVMPFSASSELESLMRAQRAEITLSETMFTPEARKLIPLLERCLQVNPRERFESAEHLYEALNRTIETEGGNSHKASLGESLSSWVRALTESATPENRSNDVPPLVAKHVLASARIRRKKTAPLIRSVVLDRALTDSDVSRESLLSSQNHSSSTSGPKANGGRHPLGWRVIIGAVVVGPVALAGAFLWQFLDEEAILEPSRIQGTKERKKMKRVSSPRETRPPKASVKTRRRIAYGYLTLNSLPRTTVYLDGKRIGKTPIRKHRIKIGRHRLLLEDRYGRVVRSFITRIRPGKTRVHRIFSR